MSKKRGFMAVQCAAGFFGVTRGSARK